MTEIVRPEDDREVLATLLGKAIKEKDDQALVSLVALLGSPRYFRQIRRYLSAIPDAHTSTREDVIQETFIRFMERVRSGELNEVPKDVLNYVSVLARYYLRDRIRYGLHEDARESASLTSVKHTAVDTRYPGPVTEIDLRDSRRILDEALAELTPEDREALLLIQNLTYEEAAERLGKSKEAVRKNVTRSQARLLGYLVKRSPGLEARYHDLIAGDAPNRPVPTREEIRKAVDTLPPELRDVIAALHYQERSFSGLVAALGREKAEARRDAGYEMLSMQFGGLPFPETLEFTAR